MQTWRCGIRKFPLSGVPPWHVAHTYHLWVIPWAPDWCKHSPWHAWCVHFPLHVHVYRSRTPALDHGIKLIWLAAETASGTHTHFWLAVRTPPSLKGFVWESPFSDSASFSTHFQRISSNFWVEMLEDPLIFTANHFLNEDSTDSNVSMPLFHSFREVFYPENWKAISWSCIDLAAALLWNFSD